MAYSANERQEEYCKIKINDRGEHIRVARVIPNNKSSMQSIDIREMYTDSEGELRFTQRGIRIKDEYIVETVKAILNAMTEQEFNEVMKEFGCDNEDTENDEDVDDFEDMDDFEDVDGFEDMDFLEDAEGIEDMDFLEDAEGIEDTEENKDTENKE